MVARSTPNTRGAVRVGRPNPKPLNTVGDVVLQAVADCFTPAPILRYSSLLAWYLEAYAGGDYSRENVAATIRQFRDTELEEVIAAMRFGPTHFRAKFGDDAIDIVPG